MDPAFVSDNLASWPVQTSAAHRKQRQEASRIAESKIVQGLKDALHSATQELQTTKEENKSLKEQIVALEDGHKMVVSSLQEELKHKDEALQRCVKKRRARTKAYIELLHELTVKEMEINTKEQRWSSTYQATERSLKEEKKKVEELQMNSKLLFEKLQEKQDEWKNLFQEPAPNATQQEETLEINSHEEKLESHDGEEEGTDEPRKDKKKQEGKEEKQETEEESQENFERESDEKMEDKTTTDTHRSKEEEQGLARAEDLNPNLCLFPSPLSPSDASPSTSSLPLSRAPCYSLTSSYSLHYILSLHTFPHCSPQSYPVSRRAPSYYSPLFSKPVQPMNFNQ